MHGWGNPAPSIDYLLGQVLERTDAIREHQAHIQAELIVIRDRLDRGADAFHDLHERTARIEEAHEQAKSARDPSHDWDKIAERIKWGLSLIISTGLLLHASTRTAGLDILKALLGGH